MRTIRQTFLLLLLGSLCCVYFLSPISHVLAATDLSGQKIPEGTDQLSLFITIFYQWLVRLILLGAFASGMYGTYLYMFSGGDVGKVDKARQLLVSALGALFAVVAVFWILNLVAPCLVSVSAVNKRNCPTPSDQSVNKQVDGDTTGTEKSPGLAVPPEKQ